MLHTHNADYLIIELHPLTTQLQEVGRLLHDIQDPCHTEQLAQV